MAVLKYVLEIAGPYQPKIQYLNNFDEVLTVYQHVGNYTNPALCFRGDRFPLDRINEAEKNKLIHSANFTKTLAKLFDNLNGKRKRVLSLCARIIEGPNMKFISGSGMTPATRRRVTMFEVESSEFIQ